MASKYTGSCLCGKVRYEIRGGLSAFVLCHCRMCRKASGTAFASNAEVPRDAFVLTAGADHVAAYSASPQKRRHFCGNCGSPLFSERDGAPVVRLRVGTLDTPIEARPIGHIFAASRAEWLEICDSLPQYDELEPERR